MGRSWGGVSFFFFWFSLFSFSSFFSFCSFASESPEEADFRIIATNDLHCRLRPDGSPLHLGGYARLKTAIAQFKSEQPASLALDAGDWAEGSIYYTLDAGRECLKMLDRIGVDYSVIGNHDWLNGPEHLLNLFQTVRPGLGFIASNLNLDEFSRATEFANEFPTFVIREVAGVKVAILGLSTYEWIYDTYLKPVKVRDPLRITYEITHELKAKGMADVIVVLSHNSIIANKAILKYAPDIDIIVGAHDHEKLTHPIEVSRRPWGSGVGYIVEGGSWGRYLTKLDLHFSKTKGLSVKSELVQIDSKFQADPAVNEAIAALETQVEAQRGPVFKEPIATARRMFFRNGIESPIGNLITDSYRNSTGAEVAVESFRFVYGEIYSGPITRADVLNVNPAVWDRYTRKTWTLKKSYLTGRTIKRMLDIAYGPAILSYYGFLTLSGVTFAYDPWFNREEGSPFSLSRFFKAIGSLISGPSVSGVQDIRVAGEPLDQERLYSVALGEGIVQGMQFISSYIKDLLPIESLQDTGKENWEVLADYMGNLKTLDRLNVPGGRIQTLHSDLGISYEDISWTPISYSKEGMKAEVSVRVRNLGRQYSKAGHWFSKGPTLHLYANKNGDDLSKDPEYVDLVVPFDVPSIEPDGKPVFVWTATIPEVNGRFPVTAALKGIDTEVNPTNNQMTRWFALDQDPILTPKQEMDRQVELGAEGLL